MIGERAAGQGEKEKEEERQRWEENERWEGKEGGARPHAGVLAAKCWMDCLPPAPQCG